MTVQAKYFIDTSDVLSIRVECKHCRASVLLPIQKEFQANALGACPNCKKPWLALPTAQTFVPVLNEFASSLIEIATKLTEWRGKMEAAAVPGFSFDLEIRGPMPLTYQKSMDQQ